MWLSQGGNQAESGKVRVVIKMVVVGQGSNGQSGW